MIAWSLYSYLSREREIERALSVRLQDPGFSSPEAVSLMEECDLTC